jgi:hypothetical protein
VLIGWYHLTLRTVTVATVPILGDVENVTESHILAFYEPVGDQLLGVHDVCTIEVSGSTDIVQTTLPPAFVDSLPLNRYSVALSTVDGVQRIDATFHEVFIGYDPALGPIPTTITDPQVADTDGDGMPAATLVVTVPLFDPVPVRTAQHTQVRVDGAWNGTQWEGTSELLTIEAIVLEADSPLFQRQPVVRATSGDFTLVPLEGRVDCVQLVESLKEP